METLQRVFSLISSAQSAVVGSSRLMVRSSIKNAAANFRRLALRMLLRCVRVVVQDEVRQLVRGVEPGSRHHRLLGAEHDDRAAVVANREGVDLAPELREPDDDDAVSLEDSHHVRDRCVVELPRSTDRGRGSFDVGCRAGWQAGEIERGKVDVFLERGDEVVEDARLCEMAPTNTRRCRLKASEEAFTRLVTRTGDEEVEGTARRLRESPRASARPVGSSHAPAGSTLGA